LVVDCRIHERESGHPGGGRRRAQPPAVGYLPAAAQALGRALAEGPAHALAAAKAALNRGLAADLWTELEATVTAQIGCFRTQDFAEGVRALDERRPPRFTGG